MENKIRRGSELNNVRETWDANERLRSGTDAEKDNLSTQNVEENDIDKIVHKEAAEYDNDHLEDKKLGGDRASVNDDDKT